jgi:peptide/nickel transport system permease protein
MAAIDKALPPAAHTAPRSASRQALDRFLRRGSAKAALVTVLLVMLSALFAPLLAPYPADAGSSAHLDQRLVSPGGRFWFGTDNLGRDVFSRVLFGGQVSLVIGFTSVALAASIGTVVGVLGGYLRGWIDEILMRLADIFLGVPSLVLAVLVVLTLGGGPEMTIFAIAATTWPKYARVVRSEVLRTRVLEFVTAATAYGARPLLIMRRHIFPAVQPTLTAQASLQVGSAILVASSLSFIGLGARPPSPEWGLSIAQGREYLPESWWVSFFPGMLILVTVVALNILGDGIRVALDARAE